MKILKLCHKCNKEFELKYFESHGGTVLTTNFEYCPHCGTRNDTWIQLVSEKRLNEEKLLVIIAYGNTPNEAQLKEVFSK